MSDLQTLLTEFAAGRVALIERHEASARAVSHYDFNNTYQYVINREETHLSWLQNALAEYHAVLPPAGADALPAPAAPKTRQEGRASALPRHSRRRRAVSRGVRGEVASSRRRDDACPPPQHAQRDSRRVDRAQAVLRAGGRRLRGSARPPDGRRRARGAAESSAQLDALAWS